jgi:hypothetical protein
LSKKQNKLKTKTQPKVIPVPTNNSILTFFAKFGNKLNENLCGFCGEVCGSNNEISRKTGQTIFSCTHYKTYSNGAASKSSGRTPCTNRLLSCPTEWIFY